MDIIEKKADTDGKSYNFNLETKQKYGIVGGLAWPEKTDGFLVVAAVDLFEDPGVEDHHIRILAETNESDMNTFLSRALKFQRCFPRSWRT